MSTARISSRSTRRSSAAAGAAGQGRQERRSAGRPEHAAAECGERTSHGCAPFGVGCHKAPAAAAAPIGSGGGSRSAVAAATGRGSGRPRPRGCAAGGGGRGSRSGAARTRRDRCRRACQPAETTSWTSCSLVSASSRSATLTGSPIAVSGSRPVAHLADDGRAGVQADDHAQRLAQIVLELPVERSSAAPCRAPASARRRPPRRGVDTEQRHDPVADELVDMAARGLDRLAHRLEIAVEHEDDVVGQPILAQAGEGAQIGEQHRDLALDALARVDRPGRRSGRRRRQQRHDLEVGSAAAGRRGGRRRR